MRRAKIVFLSWNATCGYKSHAHLDPKSRVRDVHVYGERAGKVVVVPDDAIPTDAVLVSEAYLIDERQRRDTLRGVRAGRPMQDIIR